MDNPGRRRIHISDVYARNYALSATDRRGRYDRQVASLDHNTTSLRQNIYSLIRRQPNRGPMNDARFRRLRGGPKERRVRRNVQRYEIFPWNPIVIMHSPMPCTGGMTQPTTPTAQTTRMYGVNVSDN
jgi:hypothetical protein